MTTVEESGTAEGEEMNLKLTGSYCRLITKLYVAGALISVVDGDTVMLMQLTDCTRQTRHSNHHSDLTLCNMLILLQMQQLSRPPHPPLPPFPSLFSPLPSPFQMILLYPLAINFILMRSSQISEEDGGKSRMRSTGASLFHRAIGRQTSAAWGNRIVKDFYDLDYDLSSTLTRFNHKFKSNARAQRGRVKEGIKKMELSNKKNSLGKSLEVGNRSRSKERAAEMAKHNPESIQLGALPNSNSKQQGLCPFEYQNTIAGRMQQRRNHHLSFQKNKIKRLVNENPIYYNRHEELDFSHSKLMNERKLMKTYHPFDSYTDRSVFEPKEELDKFFDTDDARKTLSPRHGKQAVRQFSKVVGRSPQKLNESAVLAYQTLPGVLKLKKKSISLPLQTTPRQISFSPQIFSERRGCYR